MSAQAADVSVRTRTTAVSITKERVLPFPREERAASVWGEEACWTGCQSYCTWGEASCVQLDAQGVCLKATDRCDRYCQRQCRTSGGPLVAPLLGLID
jgi:hypothetical protein